MKDFAAQLPQVFRHSANRAQPGAEGLLEQHAGGYKYAEQDHRGGVDLRNMAGSEEVAQVDETGDGQPAIDPSGPVDIRCGAVALKITHPQQELNAQEGVEQKKGDLDRAARLL